jgi:hypothetical protein
MKRKFSFNLAPVVSAANPTPISPSGCFSSATGTRTDSVQKVTSKTDTLVKPTPEPTPAVIHQPTHTHRRHTSKDSIASIVNPHLINRRELSPKTELELRAACALILQNFKPSDHDLRDVDPKLDFLGMDKRREYKSGTDQVRARKSSVVPTETRSGDAKKQSHREERATKQNPDLPMQANTSRRRAEHTSGAEREQEKRRDVRPPPSDAPRSTTAKSEVDTEDSKSVGTPLTDSRDLHANNGSTAPTSVALTSEGSSKRASRHLESAAAIADAQAAQWMRQELEKRRHQLPSGPQTHPKVEEGPSRPPSRARSIRSLKSGIKEYVFPGSATLSRTQSRESLNTVNSHTSSQVEGKQSRWRSWNFQRKNSSRASSRPGTSKGRTESQEQDKKGELNLNRELPPLPGLDSWDKQEEQAKQKETAKSQAPNAHIATLMRPQDQRQEYAAAVRNYHRRSGSDTLAIRHANSTQPQPSTSVGRTASLKKAHAVNDSTGRSKSKSDMHMDFDRMMSAMDPSSPRTLTDRPKDHASQSSASNAGAGMSRSHSVRDGRNEALNFSRKISTDAVRSPGYKSDKGLYKNAVQITGPPKDESKNKLKKVLSGWLRKEKKENWMNQVEKNGVRGGVMTQDEAALPPVVRY